MARKAMHGKMEENSEIQDKDQKPLCCLWEAERLSGKI